MAANKEAQRELVEKGFMLGVDWLLRTIVSNPLWNLESSDAKLLKERAQKIITTYGR